MSKQGLFAGSTVSARFGRRMVMFTMSVYALISVPITVLSTSKEQMLAARIINCKHYPHVTVAKPANGDQLHT